MPQGGGPLRAQASKVTAQLLHATTQLRTTMRSHLVSQAKDPETKSSDMASQAPVSDAASNQCPKPA